MKKHAELRELNGKKTTYKREAEVHAIGKAGLEIILDNPEMGGREIWKIFRDSCLIDSLYENSVRIVVRRSHPVRILIRTEFGDLETEAKLIRYELSHPSPDVIEAVLEYALEDSDETIGFHLLLSEPSDQT